MKDYGLHIKRLPNETVKDFYLKTKKMFTFLNKDLKDIG